MQELLHQAQYPSASVQQQQASTSGTQLPRFIVRGTARTGELILVEPNSTFLMHLGPNGTETSTPLLSKGAMKAATTATAAAPASSQSWSRVAPRQTTPSSVPLTPTTSVRAHIEQLVQARILGDTTQVRSVDAKRLITLFFITATIVLLACTDRLSASNKRPYNVTT